MHRIYYLKFENLFLLPFYSFVYTIALSAVTNNTLLCHGGTANNSVLQSLNVLHNDI